MEKISTSLLILMGVQQVVHLLSLIQVDPILVTTGLEHHLVLSAGHLLLYYQVRTYKNSIMIAYMHSYRE